MSLTPEMLHARLRQSARRLRWSRSARFAMSGLAVALSVFMAGLMLDTRFHLGAAGRWLGFLATVLPIVAGLVRGAMAWRWPISEAGLARRIESACDGSRNVLISAVQFDSLRAADPELHRVIFAEMVNPFPKVRWAEVFDLRLLKKLGIILSVLALVLAVSAVLSPERFANSATRMLMPVKPIDPLTRTRIREVRPGNMQVVHGSNFSIVAAVDGEVPRVAWVVFRESGSSWQRTPMEHEAGQPQFAFTWKGVQQPMGFRVEAGDAVSPTYQLAVRPKTAVRARTAEIRMPAYTKRAPVLVKDFSILQNVLPGSMVTVTVDFNYPLAELRVADEKETPIDATRLTDTRWRWADAVKANRKIQLAYRDQEGISDSDTLQINVAPDEAPRVEISDPPAGKDVLAVRNTILGIKFACADPYGLGSVALYRGTGEGDHGQLIQQWKEAEGQRSFSMQAQVPLERNSAPNDDKVTFVVVARDQNDVTGPGVTVSRPVTVTLRSAEKMRQQVEDLTRQLQQGLRDLIRLQQTNLDETRGVARVKSAASETITPLLSRQTEVSETARNLSLFADVIAPRIRDTLVALGEKEMKEAELTLRTAIGSTDPLRGKFLARATELEALILARLQGTPDAVAADAERERIKDLLGGVDDLLRIQREILRDTGGASETTGATLATRQDTLADRSLNVRRDLDRGATTVPLGDRQFAARLQKVAAMFGELRIYEDMLTSAERLQSKRLPDASNIQKRVIANLAKMLQALNEWRIARAQQEVGQMKKEAEEMKDRLGKLEAIQREIVEKSKDLARKDEFRPEDQATAKEIKESKDLMLEVIEQMLTDAHVFPDLKPSNELRSELVSIYEDVIQTDKPEAAEGKLKPQEIAVQKEDSLLKAIEESKKISEDMEMWLPNKLETQKWLMENFDKQEMPDIPNLPLPEAFEDIVGDLLQEQEGLNQEVIDAASNQAFAQNPANGWEIRDGPMPGFGAQGKSGNERPNQNEQTGRSAGGREGMSTGEMVADRASNLEGTQADARRTKDPLQQGQIQDDGGGNPVKATGGGKIGGFSDRQGMDGNAPLRGTNAPRQLTNNALATEQALLAEKTSQTCAKASLLYLRTDGMTDVVRLMEESQQALKDGRLRDYTSLHHRIVRRLDEVKGGINTGDVVKLPSQSRESVRLTDKQLLGGSEGEVPVQYKDMVGEYFRALNER